MIVVFALVAVAAGAGAKMRWRHLAAARDADYGQQMRFEVAWQVLMAAALIAAIVGLTRTT